MNKCNLKSNALNDYTYKEFNFNEIIKSIS